MKLLNWILILLLGPMLVACVTQPIETKPAKVFEFDSFVENNLGANTLVNRPPLCGTWLSYLRGIVKAESNWNPNAMYEEKFIDGSTGKRALSVGYFQLSIGDKRNYKTHYCQLLTEETLKDPEINTGCALEIIETLFKKGRPLGAYWSTMRPENQHKVKCNG